MNDEFPVKVIASVVTTISVALALLLTLAMWGCPKYNVYSQEMSGKAALARADQDRQIAVAEARAKEEAAKFLAAAEVARAEGIAKANLIIAEGLGGPEGYLRWLYIDALQHQKCQTVYIPTEAGIPIVEIGRSLAVPKP